MAMYAQNPDFEAAMNDLTADLVDGTDVYDCDLCADTGELPTWGPNDGCAAFMDGPEMMPCSCAAGTVIRDRNIRRMQVERAITASMETTHPGLIESSDDFRLAIAYALETGAYTQTQRELRSADCFCISGVACDLYRRFVAEPDGSQPRWFAIQNIDGDDNPGWRFGYTRDSAAQTFCPSSVEDLFNGYPEDDPDERRLKLHTLVAHNDAGATFPELAEEVLHGM